MENLWNWVVQLPVTFLPFFEWLTEPLPYLDITPLALFGITGLVAVIALLLVRLVVGG